MNQPSEEKPIKTVPDASNIQAIQTMLRHAYDWGVKSGFITFDGDGVPVCAVPAGMQQAAQQGNGKARMQNKAAA